MADGTLAATESKALATLEAIIERGQRTFIEVGSALESIRRDRLYRDTHETFGDYCKERWGFTRQRAHQLIDASKVSTIVDVPSEAHARELARVPEDQRQEVLDLATKKADGRPLTASLLKQTAREWMTPSDDPPPREYEPYGEEDYEEEAIESEPVMDLVTDHHAEWLAEATDELVEATGDAGMVAGFLDGLVALIRESESAVVASRLENKAEALRSE